MSGIHLNSIDNVKGKIIINRNFELTNTCKINGTKSSGTGFFYKIDETVYCITNRHVIENNCQLNIMYNEHNILDEHTVQYKTNRIQLNISDIYFHKKQTIDLCLIKIHKITNVICLTNENIETSKNDIIHNCDYISLYPDIFMRGYPASNNSRFPFNRTGTLSTNILDIDNDDFICDMHSISGYSGSPIYLKLTNASLGKQYCILLGINKGYVKAENDVVKLVYNQGKITTVSTSYICTANDRQSLGICAKNILDIENDIRKSNKKKPHEIAPNNEEL